MGEGEPVRAQPRLLRLELAAAAWSSESAPLAQCRSSAPAPPQGIHLVALVAARHSRGRPSH